MTSALPCGDEYPDHLPHTHKLLTKRIGEPEVEREFYCPGKGPQPTSPENELRKDNVLTQALAMVFGDRQEDYGPPTQSFQSIASLWTAYLNAKAHEPGQAITAVDVANMMILLKVGRATTGGYKQDGYVDIAGYALCVERIHRGA